MEVSVRIKQAWIKDTQRFKLRCRVQTGSSESTPGEAHEASTSIGAAAAAFTAHEFSFSFASRPTQISLLFLATTARADSTMPRQEKELGNCQVTSLTSSAPSSEQTKTLFFGQSVQETNVDRFTGKVTYTISFKETSSPKLPSLLSDESERGFQRVLPSETPFVTVVFHCVCARDDPARELVGVARIGDRSDICVYTLLQETSPVIQRLPFLKPVRLSCQDFDCLEIHVADSKTGVVEFSSSRPMNRLPPFTPTHIFYDRQSLLGRGRQGNTHSNTKEPSVSVSALYAPSASRFAQFEGLEMAVCNVTTPPQISHHRDIVMRVQCGVHGSNKGKAPLANQGSTDYPPFASQSPTKKLSGDSTPDEGFHIAVLKYQHKEMSARRSVVKSYHFFHSSFLKPGGIHLLFHLYGSSGDKVWWSTDSYVSAELTISEETLTGLQTGKLPVFQWSATSRKVSSQSCSLSGLLRWKPRKAKFFTESAVQKTFVALVSKTSPQEHATEGLVDFEGHRSIDFSPEAEDDDDTDVVKQLAEFESNLHQMAGDFHMLRRENQCLLQEKKQLEEEMAILRSLIGTADPLTDSELQQLSKSDLILRVRSLQQSLDAEKGARQRYQEMRRTLESEIAALQEIEVHYSRLQEVHETEQNSIQLLRNKVAKYKRCSDICMKQDSVMTQLESLLAEKVLSNPSRQEDAISLLGRENAQLRSWLHLSQTTGSGGDSAHQVALLQKDQVIQSLQSQISQLVTRCRALETEKKQGKGVMGGLMPTEKRELQVTIFKLEQKLLAVEAKLSAQAVQLQQNADKWIQEKANYELRIAKYQSQLDTIVKSGCQTLTAKDARSTIGASRPKDGNSKMQFPSNLSGKTNKKDFSF